MGLVGFQVNFPQLNAELFGIRKIPGWKLGMMESWSFDFRSGVRCGKPMGGQKSEKIFD